MRLEATSRTLLIAAMLSLFGATVVRATPDPGSQPKDQAAQGKPDKKDKKDKKNNRYKNKDKHDHQQAAQAQHRQNGHQRQADRRDHAQQQAKQDQRDQAQQAHQAKIQGQRAQQALRQQQAQDRRARIARQQANQAAVRLSQQRQQELIEIQRRRAIAYHQRLVEQERLLGERTESLRAANRLAQYRYQQQYLGQLRQQQLTVSRGYDYGNDPYYYTAPTYRYYRSGRYYQVNQYAADRLKQALNYGYEQGVRAAQADREDRWSQGSYQNSYAYQDATYGYDGDYVDLAEYQYYFRQGFRRGYQDGSNDRYQYGVSSNGKFSLLANVLNAILSLQSLR